MQTGLLNLISNVKGVIKPSRNGGMRSVTKFYFRFNDMMAMGAINAANELGIQVPEQLSIIGYDDIHIAKYVAILTTIHQPKYRLDKLL